MQCPRCQHENPPESRFCFECGARLALTCSKCGTELPTGVKFCNQCGQPVAGPGPVESRFASPQAYTPKHLAEKILTSRSALEGERKLVTVLFVDVSGFTALSEELDPEEIHGLMTRAFEAMLAEVHRYEGTVNQFLGDGIMALFGAPIAHEDHARRAVHAALGIRKALEVYQEESQRRGIRFQVRQGLNTGLVVVGSIGSDLRMDYTAVGDTTNVAARLQQAAQPGQILIAEPTHRLLAGYFYTRPLGELALKGKARAVGAWEVIAARVGQHLEAEADRGLTPFVGREPELGLLGGLFEKVATGHGQVVFLVGEPGIGKSRLLHEFRRRLGEGAGWLEGRCLSFGYSTAFLPILDTLRQRFGIGTADGQPEIVDKVSHGLEVLGERGAALAPFLRYLLAVDPADPSVAPMDPTARRARLIHAFQQLVLLDSRTRPLVLVIEDTHWIDSSSEECLNGLIDGLAAAALLLVLPYRPTYRPPFVEHTYVSRLVLQPLEEPAAHQLVRAVLGVEEVPQELVALMASKAEGNPFFFEELGRALLETGAVRREDGRLLLVRPAASIVVPDRVQNVIAARLDRLADNQKRTLQMASAIGREFPLRLLRRVVDTPERLEPILAGLKALEFIYERVTSGEPEYAFKHALTQEVAYESILHARRRALHARIGAAIEELYADRREERAEELADHFMRGETWLKAAHYARQAGDRAAALCADTKAVECYERELEAIGRLPVTPETVRLGIDARLALRAPLWRAGRLDRLSEIFREAEALATEYGETQRLDVVYSFFVQYHWAKGEHSDAVAYGQRCLDLARRRADLGLSVTAHYYSGWARLSSGQYEPALEHFRQILEALEGPRATERFGLSGLPYCGASALAAQCLTALGDHAGALELIRRGERVADAANHLYSKMPLAIARGRALLSLGCAADALGALEPTAATCREKKFAGQLMHALTWLAHAYVLAGRATSGIPAAQEAVRLHQEANAFADHSMMLGALAECHLHAGQLDAAETTAREALEFAQRHAERGYEASIRWTLGELARVRGDQATAARHLEDARSIAHALDMRPLEAHCHFALGTLYQRTGDGQRAHAHLGTATTMFRDMDMRFWLGQAEAELKALS